MRRSIIRDLCHDFWGDIDLRSDVTWSVGVGTWLAGSEVYLDSRASSHAIEGGCLGGSK